METNTEGEGATSIVLLTDSAISMMQRINSGLHLTSEQEAELFNAIVLATGANVPKESNKQQGE